METTVKGDCFLFVNNDVQNVSLKMILNMVEDINEEMLVSYMDFIPNFYKFFRCFGDKVPMPPICKPVEAIFVKPQNI
tara:strand:- start:9567 stop:9800 length:234 start_codon:yes stop_codon:yes gene_type:complete